MPAERGPGAGEAGKPFRPVRRQGIIDATAAADRLALGLQRAVLFQRVQHRIDHALGQHDLAVGPLADRLHQLIAIHLLVLQQAQHQQLGHAIHEGGARFAFRHVQPHA